MIAPRHAGLLAVLLGTCLRAHGFAEDAKPPRFELPVELPIRQVECAVEDGDNLRDLAPVFDLMKNSREQAVACVAFLDTHNPGWHDAPGADELVAPFVSYLLGDGTAKGLQRHAIFIQLLGHLEKIAADWRLRDSVEAMLPEIILGSIVEDPFVANFWATALPEIDQQWMDSEAARSVLPTVYEIALQEETGDADTKNLRPRATLKELSRLSYARFVLATKVFDSWPKRFLWVALTILLLVLATRRLRRRNRP